MEGVRKHTESTVKEAVASLDGVVDDVGGGLRGDLPQAVAVSGLASSAWKAKSLEERS
jgi:hypothetical protein